MIKDAIEDAESLDWTESSIDLYLDGWRSLEERKGGVMSEPTLEQVIENQQNVIELWAKKYAELEQRLYVAMDLLQQIHDCPVNWVESTFPKGGMNPDNPKHRGQVVGTQHISYTRLYNIAAFLHQNIEHEKGE